MIEYEGSAKVERLYKASGDLDTTEGRGGSKDLGTYPDKHTAEMVTRGQGVMGGDGYVHEVRLLHLGNGEVYEIGRKVNPEEYELSTVRARALSKLTPEERRALGI